MAAAQAPSRPSSKAPHKKPHPELQEAPARVVRTVRLKALLDSRLQVDLSSGSLQLLRTSPKPAAPSVAWPQHHFLELPADKSKVEITLWRQHARRSAPDGSPEPEETPRDSILGFASINFESFKKVQTQHEVVQFVVATGLLKAGEPPVLLHIDFAIQDLQVFARRKYKQLSKYLFEGDCQASLNLLRALKGEERALVASLLLKISVAESQLLPLFKRIVHADVEAAPGREALNMLFYSESSSLSSFFYRLLLEQSQAWRAAFLPFFEFVHSKPDFDCELAKSSIRSFSMIEDNAANLALFCTRFTKHLFEAKTLLPLPCQLFLSVLRAEVDLKFPPTPEHSSLHLLSSLLLDRFIFPSLSDPSLSGFLPPPPAPMKVHLKAISLVLHRLSTFTVFTSSEKHWEAINPWLEPQRDALKRVLEQFACTEDPSAGQTLDSDEVAHQYALLSALLWGHSSHGKEAKEGGRETVVDAESPPVSRAGSANPSVASLSPASRRRAASISSGPSVPPLKTRSPDKEKKLVPGLQMSEAALDAASDAQAEAASKKPEEHALPLPVVRAGPNLNQRSVTATVNEVRGLPKGGSYFVEVSSSGRKVEASRQVKGGKAVIEQTFSFPLRPEDHTLELLLMRVKSSAPPVLLGLIVLDYADLPLDAPYERWLPISLLQPLEDKDDGVQLEMQVCIALKETLLLPADAYAEFVETLFAPPDYALLSTLFLVADDADLAELGEAADSVARLAFGTGRAEALFNFLLAEELKNTATAEVLFRSDSFTVRAMTTYVRLCSSSYVLALKPFLAYAADFAALDYEIADERLNPGANLNENISNLLQLLSYAFSCLLGSAPSCPVPLKRLFASIKQAVLLRFPEEAAKGIDQRGICSFLFLRLFVPALINPVEFGLLEQAPNEKLARALTLVASTIQKVGNFSTFPSSQLHFHRLNDWVLSSTSLLKDMIASLIEGADASSKPTTGEVASQAAKLVALIKRRLGPSKRATALLRVIEKIERVAAMAQELEKQARHSRVHDMDVRLGVKGSGADHHHGLRNRGVSEAHMARPHSNTMIRNKSTETVPRSQLKREPSGSSNPLTSKPETTTTAQPTRPAKEEAPQEFADPLFSSLFRTAPPSLTASSPMPSHTTQAAPPTPAPAEAEEAAPPLRKRSKSVSDDVARRRIQPMRPSSPTIPEETASSAKATKAKRPSKEGARIEDD